MRGAVGRASIRTQSPFESRCMPGVRKILVLQSHSSVLLPEGAVDPVRVRSHQDPANSSSQTNLPLSQPALPIKPPLGALPRAAGVGKAAGSPATDASRY